MRFAEGFGIKLDYSIKSIKNVEEILSQIHLDYKKSKSEDGIRGIALEFAAYIIKVIDFNFEKGFWERDHEDFGESSFPYYWKGSTLFIYGWCMKRMLDGEGNIVWTKFQVCILEN